MKYETGESYSERHPPDGKPDGDRMEFHSVKLEMAASIYHHGFLFAPYLNYGIFNPGLGLGFKTDRFYGLAAVDFMILDKGEFGVHLPHLGGQAGVRLARNFILTYDYFHLTYSDLHSQGYGYEAWYETHSGASRISLAWGDRFYLVPGLIYVHANHRLGWALNLAVMTFEPLRPPEE